LQRRLEEEASSFLQLLNDTPRELARCRRRCGHPLASPQRLHRDVLSQGPRV